MMKVLLYQCAVSKSSNLTVFAVGDSEGSEFLMDESLDSDLALDIIGCRLYVRDRKSIV